MLLFIIQSTELLYELGSNFQCNRHFCRNQWDAKKKNS